MRARYATKLVSISLSHIYSQSLALDPLEYGFYLADGEVPMPTQGRNSIDKKAHCDMELWGKRSCQHMPLSSYSEACTHFCN